MSPLIFFIFIFVTLFVLTKILFSLNNNLHELGYRFQLHTPKLFADICGKCRIN